MKVINIAIKSLLAAIAATFMTGCIQKTPIPGYAKSGDAVVIGLGGVRRNANDIHNARILLNGMTVTITDSASVTQNVRILNAFKTFPDHAAWMEFAAVNNVDYGGNVKELVDPFDGGWFVVAKLVNSSNQPLTLAPGPATINVSSTKLTNTGEENEGNLAALPIEILSGVTTLDSTYDNMFMSFDNSTYSYGVVKASNESLLIGANGLQLEFTYNPGTFNKPYVVQRSHHPCLSLSQNTYPNGDGTNTFKVILSCVNGVTDKASRAPLQLTASDLSLAIYPPAFNGASNVNPTHLNRLTLKSSKSFYVDNSGSVISGVSPVIIHSSLE